MKRNQAHVNAITHAEVMSALCDNLGKRFPKQFVKEVVAQYLDLLAYALATGRPIMMKNIGAIQIGIGRPTHNGLSRPMSFNLTPSMQLNAIGSMKIRRILKQINYVMIPKNKSEKVEMIPKRWIL